MGCWGMSYLMQNSLSILFRTREADWRARHDMKRSGIQIYQSNHRYKQCRCRQEEKSVTQPHTHTQITNIHNYFNNNNNNSRIAKHHIRAQSRIYIFYILLYFATAVPSNSVASATQYYRHKARTHCERRIDTNTDEDDELHQ